MNTTLGVCFSLQPCVSTGLIIDESGRVNADSLPRRTNTEQGRKENDDDGEEEEEEV